VLGSASDSWRSDRRADADTRPASAWGGGPISTRGAKNKHTWGAAAARRTSDRTTDPAADRVRASRRSRTSDHAVGQAVSAKSHGEGASRQRCPWTLRISATAPSGSPLMHLRHPARGGGGGHPQWFFTLHGATKSCPDAAPAVAESPERWSKLPRPGTRSPSSCAGCRARRRARAWNPSCSCQAAGRRVWTRPWLREQIATRTCGLTRKRASGARSAPHSRSKRCLNRAILSRELGPGIEHDLDPAILRLGC